MHVISSTPLPGGNLYIFDMYVIVVEATLWLEDRTWYMFHRFQWNSHTPI